MSTNPSNKNSNFMGIISRLVGVNKGHIILDISIHIR